MLEEKLRKFALKDFNNKKKIQEYIRVFNLDRLINLLAEDTAQDSNNRESIKLKPFKPNYNDLCRLHYIALSRKTLNILEFGSGFSTLFLADAMRILNSLYFEYAKKEFRVKNPFHVYSIEESKYFFEITKKRLNKLNSPFVTLSKSSVEIILFQDLISTIYSKLPNISPDFIYIDGPSQFACKDMVNGFSLADECRMPMSADILRFEFFLEPGTLIVIDGRTANARFLRSFLKRNWLYQYDHIGDLSYFELQEEPLGRFNKEKISFCLGNKYLLT